MKPTAIIVKDGMGRPENPFSPYDPIHAEGSDLSRFDDFALNNPAHPCPSVANTEPGKTILAELRWQSPKEALTEAEQLEYSDKHGQIWVPIVEQKEGEGKPLPPAIQRLADAIEASGNKITFGLQPDQIALIESTLQEGFTTEYAFEKVAEQINWDKYTLVCWYVKHLRKQLPSPPITEK